MRVLSLGAVSSDRRRPGAVRVVLAVACAALVLAVALVLLARVLFADGGVLNDPPPVLR